MLPARVISYDRNRNIATVQPLISVLSMSGEAISRQPIASVPVLALGGGGSVINFHGLLGAVSGITDIDGDGLLPSSYPASYPIKNPTIHPTRSASKIESAYFIFPIPFYRKYRSELVNLLNL